MKKCGRTSDSRQSGTSSSTTAQFATPSLWSESSLLFGRSKGRYLALTVRGDEEMQVIPHRIDAECCTTVTQDGREMQMWLFVDLHNFEMFCKQCTESIDCCVACYSITTGQTYRSVIEEWIPEFMNMFPGKPIILCGLDNSEVCTCSGGMHEIMFQHDFNFCNSHLTQMDVSIFDKV
uniref:Bm9822 n=1 Tax=Brugia malayi TaxID=6279 RepID=A0A0H5S676_BRUMA|nr:Bm9822 [Brugia malayi]